MPETKPASDVFAACHACSKPIGNGVSHACIDISPDGADAKTYAYFCDCVGTPIKVAVNGKPPVDAVEFDYAAIRDAYKGAGAAD